MRTVINVANTESELKHFNYNSLCFQWKNIRGSFQSL